MLTWILTFLVISLIAAICGFTSIATAISNIAKVTFYIFLIVFAYPLILFLFGRKHTTAQSTINNEFGVINTSMGYISVRCDSK
jgi:uncharacterized membrane protein YtjA (UPF0391 family)